jgi:SAM-dependent methyltransferase
VESTGERLVPEQQGDVAIEHLHRYALARELAGGKIVLDVASGEGYGSSLLSGAASRVIGVDLCPDAVAHARAAYASENLEFLVGRCTALPIADASIDLVVSFETLEHVHEPELVLDEFRRVLKPDGLLLLSTPDRDVYAVELHRDNPFHLREVNVCELRSLLGCRFGWQRLFRQRLVRGSLVVEEPDDLALEQVAAFQTLRGDFSSTCSRKGLANAVYLIALASNAPINSTVCGYFESQTVADDLLKELAFSRVRVLMLEQQLGSLQSQMARATETIESQAREVERLHRIVASRFWRYTGALRRGGALGVRVARRMSKRLGWRRRRNGNAQPILTSKPHDSVNRPGLAAAARPAPLPSLPFMDLQRRCAELEQQLSQQEHELQNVINSLKQQKIMLVQERDELSRQRQSLMRQLASAEERLRALEVRLTCPM